MYNIHSGIVLVTITRKLLEKNLSNLFVPVEMTLQWTDKMRMYPRLPWQIYL